MSTFFSNLKNSYSTKYSDIPLDLIITSDDNAFTFLLKYRKELFGETIEISEWRDGISFFIHTEQEFDKLAEWLGL